MNSDLSLTCTDPGIFVRGVQVIYRSQMVNFKENYRAWTTTMDKPIHEREHNDCQWLIKKSHGRCWLEWQISITKLSNAYLCHFSSYRWGPTFSRGGPTFSRVWGSNCLFPIETHITCDFPGWVRTCLSRHNWNFVNLIFFHAIKSWLISSWYIYWQFYRVKPIKSIINWTLSNLTVTRENWILRVLYAKCMFSDKSAMQVWMLISATPESGFSLTSLHMNVSMISLYVCAWERVFSFWARA